MPSSDLGRRLAQLRRDLGWSQREEAHRASTNGHGGHLSSTAISKIEKGDRNPKLASLESLSAALGIRIVIEPGGTHIEQLGPPAA